MAHTLPKTFEITVKGTCPSHARTEIAVRHHTLLIDEPVERDGTDLAPSPLETMLASLLGCTNVIANIIAKQMGIEIEIRSLALTASLDSRGIFGKADVAVPFPEIAMTLDVVTGADPADIETLKEALGRRCPVSRLLRESGTKIVEEWRITAP